MIAKMQKAFVVARRADRDRLLEALRELGAVHLQPHDAEKATAAEETLRQLDHLGRAIQVLEGLEPQGQPPDLSAVEAAEEVLRGQRAEAEKRSRLSALHREIDQLELWGDVRLEQFNQLRRNGIELKFYSAPAERAGEFEAELVRIIRPLPQKRDLVAVVVRGDASQLKIPDEAREIELPQRDRPAIRREAKQIDQELKDGAERLCALRHLLGEMIETRRQLQQQAEYTVAERGGLDAENLFAIQGWVPAEKAKALAGGLTAAGLHAAVELLDPAEDERPPTLVQYPRWARPIKGLFDILGTLPGYKELDVAPFFMIALPIFAAMLIGDAGYGLIFLLLPLAFYKKIAAKAGKVQVQLLMVMGAATIAWGILAGNIFGVSPGQLMSAGGLLGRLGSLLDRLQVIRGDVTQQAYTIMKVSFVIAVIHLSLAQLRQALTLAPSLSCLAKVGWAAFLWGIFFVIWYLFFGSQVTPPRPPYWLTPYLLLIGGCLAILFAHPSRNPFKTLGLGIASFPLAALGTFSDTISYIRLWGVGLASTIIAQTFNSLAAQAAEATWLAAAPILLLGHALNIAMCMIAILAHGVRLNMLEFSNNAGVQWAGYAYKPFAIAQKKER